MCIRTHKPPATSSKICSRASFRTLGGFSLSKTPEQSHSPLLCWKMWPETFWCSRMLQTVLAASPGVWGNCCSKKELGWRALDVSSLCPGQSRAPLMPGKVQEQLPSPCQLSLLLPHSYEESGCVWTFGFFTHHPHAAGSPCLWVAGTSCSSLGFLSCAKGERLSRTLHIFPVDPWDAQLSHLHSKSSAHTVTLVSISSPSFLVPCLPSLVCVQLINLPSSPSLFI